MRILIRTEIGGAYGLGHGTRMRALAHALAAHGVDVAFVTETPALIPFVQPFVCHQVTTWNLTPDICVIDTKGRAAMAPMHGAQVVRIDNPHADEVETDLCIVPCAHWSADTVSRLRTAFGERFLYGWDYVMLDPAVTAQPPIPYSERQDGPIVLCAGGSDPGGALAKMWQWSLDMPSEIEQRLVFMVGAMQQDAFREAMEAFGQPQVGAHMPTNRLLIPFDREHLRHAALVVGFMGQTTLECIWYNTPMLCFARTEGDYEALLRLELWQQRDGAPALIQSFWLSGGENPWYGDMTPAGFRERTTTWWQQRTTYGQSSATAAMIDGRGVERVAEAILRLGER